MALKNPFEIIGLNPQVIQNLSDSQIARILKSQKKVLQRIHHPDVGGDVTRFRRVTEAYEELQKPDLYQHYKSQFLKQTPMKRKVAESQAQLAQAQQVPRQMYNQFQSYLEDMAGFQDQPTVFNIAPCTLRMLDSQRNLNIDTIRNPNMQGIFYELVVRKNGVIEKRNGKKTQKFTNKTLIGTISSKDEKLAGGIGRILTRAVGIWTHDYQRVRERLQRDSTIPRRRIEKEEKYFSGRITPEQFYSIFPLITPRVSKDSYLFSINSQPQDPQIFFALEGAVLERTPR